MCWTRSAVCSAPNWRSPRRSGTSSSPRCSCIAPSARGGLPPTHDNGKGIPVVYLVPVGRFLYSAIFLMTVLGHFSAAYIGYAAQQGVPAAGLLVPLSGVIATLGGLSVTLGYQAEVGAWLLGLFLVAVSLAVHNFWAVTGP